MMLQNPARTRSQPFPPLPDPGLQCLFGRIAFELGRRHVIMVGPPGCGKTMIARRIGACLPGPTGFADRWAAGVVRHAAGLPPTDGAPVRMPHHTISAAGLFGGGNPVRPGEVTLAHGGLLFLDELPEFSRLCLEELRWVLDRGEVEIVRAGKIVRFPARLRLLAAMNPCPCGHLGHPQRACVCSDRSFARYQARVAWFERAAARLTTPHTKET